VSALQRISSGLKSVSDPVGRRAYIGRFKWLMNGSSAMHAHSLEYRAGLTGTFAIKVERSDEDPELVMHCPADCGAHAPLSHLYERRFIYRLRKTVTSTASGATVMCGSTEPPFFVRESITWPFESILTHGLEIPEVKQAANLHSGECVVFPTNTNYYHWLIEELPLVLRAARSFPHAKFVAFRDGITDKHRKVAQLLGITLIESDVIVGLDEQVLPGRSNDSWFVHPTDAALLAEFGQRMANTTEVAPADQDSGSRVYVSRRFSKRALPGEEQLEQLLSEQGFTIAHLESMDWAEQVSLFQSASLVVGPHGAGLSNLVFTPTGATLIELTNGNQYNRCFEWICHVVGHRYLAIAADPGTKGSEPAALAAAISAQL
jgi:hypothetical protein